MSALALRALVVKDLTLFFRNRFYAFITVVGLAAYVGIYFLMPATVDETFEVAFLETTLPTALRQQLEGEGLQVVLAPTPAELRQLVEAGEVQAGIAFEDDLVPKMLRGERPRVELLLRSDLPPELQDVFRVLLQELGHMLAGQPLELEVNEEILGVDRVGAQIPPRQRMVPLVAVFLLMMETLGLATLLASEIDEGTAQALLVTPLRLEGFFFGKAVTGVGMSFVQAGLLMGIIGGLRAEPALVLLILLLGAILVTGVGFLIASVTRDMMSVLAWGILAMLTLALPGMGLLVPGLVSGWVRAIPSFYLVDAVDQVVNLGRSWPEVAGDLLALAGFALLLGAAGILALRRRLR